MDDHDEIEHLRQEVRRLKAQVFALEEEKEDLHRRYVFVCQELERTRVAAVVDPHVLTEGRPRCCVRFAALCSRRS